MLHQKKNPLTGEFVIGKTEYQKTSVSGIHEKKTEQKETLETLAKKNFSHFYSAFVTHPKNVSFKHQDTDEEILLLVRRHFVTNVPWILASLALAIIPFFVFQVITLFFPFLNISFLARILIIIFYYLILFGYILINFSTWYFNVGLVTNKRIVDLDVINTLYRNIAHTKLDLVEDVSYTQIGAIRSVFNYGDVFIQTAGEIKNFEFNRVPEPEKIINIVGDLIGKRHGHI